jgi:hypothetical protein
VDDARVTEWTEEARLVIVCTGRGTHPRRRIDRVVLIDGNLYVVHDRQHGQNSAQANHRGVDPRGRKALGYVPRCSICRQGYEWWTTDRLTQRLRKVRDDYRAGRTSEARVDLDISAPQT